MKTKTPFQSLFSPRLLRLAPALLLSACAVGPNYVRPPVVTPPAFKEAPNAQNGWVPSQPMDTIDRGAWWSVFNDETLNGLEQKVAISNQTVAQALAAYTQARALTAADRASFFPTVNLTGSGQKSGSGGGAGGVGGIITDGNGNVISTGGGGASTTTRYNAAVGATWAPDVWGRIRRQVESDNAASQASAADLANAKLSAQTELATTISTCAFWTSKSVSTMRRSRPTRSPTPSQKTSTKPGSSPRRT